MPSDATANQIIKLQTICSRQRFHSYMNYVTTSCMGKYKIRWYSKKKKSNLCPSNYKLALITVFCLWSTATKAT